MLHFVFPTKKNNYRAHLISTPGLIIFIAFVLTFNLIAQNNISAQTYTGNINVENLLAEHNSYRSENGLTTLQLNSLLTRSAIRKGEAMLNSNCWSHYCPPGVEPWKFFQDAGYQYIFAGENLAEGFNEIGTLMSAWKNSRTHRENILKSDFNEVGFGILTGSYQGNNNNILVVVHFGQQAQLVSNELTLNDKIQILAPRASEVIEGSSVNINGRVNDVSKVKIYNNGALKSEDVSVEDGIFTFKLEDPNQGRNIIEVIGIDEDGSEVKSLVEFSVNLPGVEGESVVVTPKSIFPFEITKVGQNIVNIVFIGALVLLFVIDFIIISRNHLLKHKRSLSHYHVSILIILGLLILIGGFAGNINTGLFK